MMHSFPGPESGIGPGCTKLAPGLWVTSGRAAVLEGAEHLTLIDPGDEPCGSAARPTGPLADLLRLQLQTGKRLRWVLVTHAHPDHVSNLDVFRALEGVRTAAHAESPIAPDLPIARRGLLEGGGGLEAIPTPGHSAWGDDLSFWHPASATLFSGDLVQPKGEVWERTFYPSPYVYFEDGQRYLRSLGVLAELPLRTLVTGHREVRFGADALAWIELTAHSIRRVEEAVAGWDGSADLGTAARAIYREIAKERGLPEEAVEARMGSSLGGSSPFERFDLPGIAYYWRRRGPAPGA